MYAKSAGSEARASTSPGTEPPDVNTLYSAVGDVVARLSFELRTGAVLWSVYRCRTATCSGPVDTLRSGTLAGASSTLGPHFARIQFDPFSTHASFLVDSSIEDVDLTEMLPLSFGPADVDVRRIEARAGTIGVAGSTSSIEVSVTNVFTGSR